MFLILKSPPRQTWIIALAAISLCGFARAQNFTLQVANPNPLGLGNFVPGGTDYDLGLEDNIKGDFDYGLGVTTTYNSNFFLSETAEESEVFASILPWLSYSSDPEGGAIATLTANYNPAMRVYLENSDLNGFDQTGDAVLRLRGSKTDISFFGRYSELSGTDRLTGDFVEGSIMTGGIRAYRQIAARTSLNAGWSAAMSDYGSSVNEGAEVFTTYFGGMWESSPRLSFGSSIRYTMSNSDIAGTRDAWALLMEARYRVGQRIWLSASVGPEYATNSGTGVDDSSLSLACSLSARYVINERWSWTSSINTATVPSPSETNYQVNEVAISTALYRQLLRGAISAGLEFRFSDYQAVGAVATPRDDEQYINTYLTYSRPLFSERVFFDSTLRYGINDGLTDWSQFTFSAGLNVVF